MNPYVFSLYFVQIKRDQANLVWKHECVVWYPPAEMPSFQQKLSSWISMLRQDQRKQVNHGFRYSRMNGRTFVSRTIIKADVEEDRVLGRNGHQKFACIFNITLLISGSVSCTHRWCRNTNRLRIAFSNHPLFENLFEPNSQTAFVWFYDQRTAAVWQSFTMVLSYIDL